MLPQHFRLWILIVLVAMSAATVASARPVRVVFNDGRQITGQLVAETASTVTIAVAGIETTFPRDQIQAMEAHLTLKERYEQKRAEVADDDWAGRYALARWLYDQENVELYPLAVEELDALLGDRPTHQQAQLLRRVLNDRIADEQARMEAMGEPEPQPAEDDAPAPADDRPALTAIQPLTDSDIALIKAFEVDLREEPTVVVPREIVDEIFDLYRESPALEPFLNRDGKARFLRMPGHDQLAVIFDLRARQYYDQVMIRTEPATLREFRTRFHPNYIARYCGQCHSTTQDKYDTDFQLLTQQPNDDVTAYTNLMILRRTQLDGEPMINLEDPLSSPLVQFGLPPLEAMNPHPEVRGWRPYFSNSRDRRLSDTLRWIVTLYSSEDGGDYPIDYAVPTRPQPEPRPDPETDPQPDARPEPKPIQQPVGAQGGDA
ncbi:MAG: hypothetical protein WD294_10200 [Phycisphaeraceae bacterium]